MGLRALRLPSRAARRSIAPNGRTIATSSPTIPGTASSGGGLTGFFSNITGFLIRSFSKLGDTLLKSLGAILRFLVGRFEAIGNFDFQASDEELLADIKSRNDRVYGIMGGLIGRGVGSVVAISIGVGISFAVPVIGGRALAASMLASVSKEMLEDYWGELRNAGQQIAELKAANAMARVYMKGRSFIKALPKSVLTGLVGEKNADFIKTKWGAKEAEPWTIVKYRDEKIEQIKHPGWRQFWEEFVDEGWDAFSEGLFLVAGELDDAANAHLLARQTQQLEGIELTPDREQPRETVRIYGTPAEIAQQTQQIMATHTVIGNRDVGYVGALQEEGIWIPEHQRRRLTLVSYSVKQPPWTVSSTEYRSVRAVKKQVSIPNPKTGLTWSQVKQALGGTGGYESGGYYATARMSSRRKMTVYGGSESSAEQLLKELALLSEDRIQNISVGYRSMVGQRQLSASQQRVRVYPAYAITARLRQTESEEGRLLTEGYSYAEDRKRVELWREREPADSDLFS
jgi:hypothetical protein